MRVIERPFSDLLRHPKAITEDLEDGDVLLRRRDEPDLRLTLADREAARSSAVAALGRALRNMAVHNPKALVDSLTDALPWLEFLPPKDRQLFIEEFSRVMVASAELDNYAPVSQLLSEWRATAEIHADPRLARRLKRPLQAEGRRVEPPTE
jgi:hypothetical protein